MGRVIRKLHSSESDVRERQIIPPLLGITGETFAARGKSLFLQKIMIAESQPTKLANDNASQLTV